MRRHTYSKLGLIAGIAILAASIQVHADMASASGILADIGAKAAEANNALAAAANAVANGGPAAALTAAQAQVDAIAAATQDALNAYAKLEQSGGSDAAAEQQLQDAQNAAAAAMGQEPPAETPVAGGQGFPLPNPDAILWESEQLQGLYQSLFNTVQSASAQGGTEFTDSESDVTDI